MHELAAASSLYLSLVYAQQTRYVFRFQKNFVLSVFHVNNPGTPPSGFPHTPLFNVTLCLCGDRTMSNRVAADRAHLAPRKSTLFRLESKEDPAIHRLPHRLSRFFKEKSATDAHDDSDSDPVLFRSVLAHPFFAVQELESESGFELVDWMEMLKEDG
jgi:hypothetical protein